MILEVYYRYMPLYSQRAAARRLADFAPEPAHERRAYPLHVNPRRSAGNARPARKKLLLPPFGVFCRTSG